MRRFFTLVLLCSCAAWGQEGGSNPVTGSAKTIFQRQQKNLVAAAEQMPPTSTTTSLLHSRIHSVRP